VSGPTVSHFMAEMPYCVVVRNGLAVGRRLRQLVRIEGYVVAIADGCSCWRSFLSLVGANIYRLRESQLKSATRAAALKNCLRLVVLCVPDACDIASYWTVARATCFLTIDAEVGVVNQKVELVAESLDDGAGEVLWFRHGQIVERFVHCGVWA